MDQERAIGEASGRSADVTAGMTIIFDTNFSFQFGLTTLPFGPNHATSAVGPEANFALIVDGPELV